jgi:hypothetical protein
VARAYRLGSGNKLRQLLKRDKALGVDKHNGYKLVYACRALVARNSSAGPGTGRELMGGGHWHGSHHQHHQLHHRLEHQGELRARRLLPQVGNAGGRRLQQLVQADLEDPLPSSYNLTASGVPLLHSRPAATRKIHLDFDGHTARWGPWAVGAGLLSSIRRLHASSRQTCSQCSSRSAGPSQRHPLESGGHHYHASL